MQRWMSSQRHLSAISVVSAKQDGESRTSRQAPVPKLIYIVLAVLLVGLLIVAVNVYQLQNIHSGIPYPSVEGHPGAETVQPIVWIKGRNVESGYLNHISSVFQRLGYAFGGANSDWDVLWSHDYPFIEMADEMKSLKTNQKVNHFPGSGFITNKVNLATSNLSHIPLAFRIPDDKGPLMEYVKLHPDKVFVQKSNKHRGIKVQPISTLDLDTPGTFIQEYIQKPYLIDDRKFDIGIYTIMTSIRPLRVYIYEGDALLRFCPEVYEPFDANNLNKYVVGDDYMPTWEMPSLKPYFENAGFTFKESLNAHLRSQGKDPDMLWEGIRTAIRDVYLNKEEQLYKVMSRYNSTRNFFEMVRFDFVADEHLRVFIMEANMSPNLSSAHFIQNKLLYEQVVFNLLSVVGLAQTLTQARDDSSSDVNEMLSSDKDLAVFGDVCGSQDCRLSCALPQCRLCIRCLDSEWLYTFRQAYREHLMRYNCRRVIPPPMFPDSGKGITLSHLSHLNLPNRLMYLWFQGKCYQDSTWCR